MSALQNLLVGAFLASWFLFFLFIVRWNKQRREQLASAQSAEEPWFPENEAKLAYYTLVEQHPEAQLEPSIRKQLTAALLKRAMVDIEHAQQITEERGSLQQLIKEGAIGEVIWQKLQRAEMELNEEILEVISEAESYKEGWGKTIMEEASNLLRHERRRTAQAQIQTQQQHEGNLGHQQISKQGDRAKDVSPDQERANRERLAEKAMKELLAAEEIEKRRKQGSTPTGGGKKKK